MNKIRKLGTSTSEIFQNKNSYTKKYIMNSSLEIDAIKNGLELISQTLPNSIEIPISIKEKVSNPQKIELIYEQKSLNPWISQNWITGLQLFNLGSTILKQQKILIKNSLCFVDARPSNYWLAENNGKLVDIASIKPLTKQNLLSFLSDFNNHFINPLRLEVELNIPVSSYFQGNLQSCKLNNWGLIKTIKNLSSINEQFKNSVSNFFSNIISSSSTDFIEFLNNDYEESIHKNISINKSKKLIKNLNRQFELTKPISIKNSNWNNYVSFHKSEYNEKKLKEINKFVQERKSFTKIVDIGSNLTTEKIESIYSKVDNDMSVSRAMRQSSKDNQVILHLNVAQYLCDIDDFDNNPLNCLGVCKSAIFTGIMHHLIIDYGLSIDDFYRNTSLLFDNIILEYPTIEDPMVNLLINKRNEKIKWDWEDVHREICDKYFNIVKKTDLSSTRILIELEKK